MITVNQLFFYPVKSMQGIALSAGNIQESGFQHDRRFMVTEPDGTFITARQHHHLLLLKIVMLENGIKIVAPNQQSIDAYYSDFSSNPEPTEVWNNHFSSYIASIAVNRWLSNYLQKDVQLRWLGEQSTRRIKRYPDVSLSFADGYPYLLLNQASLDYLQKICPEQLNIGRFCGNIIISGALPFAEDGWKQIKIGDVIFDLVKPCSRCILTTVDTQSAIASKLNEPLNTLRQFRSDEQGQIDFGINMIALNSGTISVNSPIEILETKPAKQYQKSAPFEPEASKEFTIDYQGQKFTGNNQQTLLEQLELHEIKIPYSCRAGICGRCQLVLEDGEVTPLTNSAVRREKKILSCSCIPKTNLKLSK
ncbi:YcbX family protein [Zophobihabitans entericus]|uniref:MOSC domain-containing protein n=1 Tax=Zophobihabitans entericus TaxID=1635327 RepID=A0A6G9IBN8_9GAMM|nr:YcbX family protein [Zophobihabitans entericus]QIQ21247.1 MOSC domain-containing protein [Zophobihabitans entericus]